MTAHCRYHCRECGSHFTSLEAFDAHHEGSGETLRPCAFPKPEALVELTGTCRIDDPTTPAIGVTVYEHERAANVREAHGGPGDGQTAPTDAKQAA